VKSLLENRIPAERGERQVMTVFFSDLQDFTRLCEGLTPDAAVRFLNRYFSLMSEVIRTRQGIVDKYIGDSVMAFWGPPFTDAADHATLCCLAALEQMARMEAFRAWLPEMFGVAHGLPVVNVRMGIASGEVTVGNIGSETSRGYTVIATVNLAHGWSEPASSTARALVSEATRQATRWPSAKSTACASPASWSRCGFGGWQRIERATGGGLRWADTLPRRIGMRRSGFRECHPSNQADSASGRSTGVAEQAGTGRWR
jgi:class 3 adenylate cyclase